MTFKRHNLTRENRFIFNGNDLSDEVVVEKINRQLLPSPMITGIKMPKENGRKFQRVTLDSRLITVTLRFIEDTYEEVQERVLKVSSLLCSDKPKKLELRDSNKFNYAIVSQMTDIDKTSSTGICEVIFECHDIYNYGEIKSFLLSETLINSGTAGSKGIITLTTKESEIITITLNEGKFLKFVGPFVADATILIDLDKEYATINGNSLMDKLSFDSDFFDIPSGSNQIQVVGATGTISFNERWY